jgi:hypothetical protein
VAGGYSGGWEALGMEVVCELLIPLCIDIIALGFLFETAVTLLAPELIKSIR